MYYPKKDYSFIKFRKSTKKDKKYDALLLNKKTILLYGVLGGLIAEVISSSLNYGQDFGDKILLRIIAATIQSIIAYYIIKYFKNRKNTKKNK